MNKNEIKIKYFPKKKKKIYDKNLKLYYIYIYLERSE
jgi:hypothetical protein